MPTDLERLLWEIHPDRTRRVTEMRADEAVISFPIDATRTRDGIKFHDVVCAFVRHVDHHIGRVPWQITLPDGMVWQRAVTLMHKAYGRQGELAALEIAGAESLEGGLYPVLKEIARRAVDTHVNEQIELRVNGFCNRLSAKEYLAAAAQYIELYGYLVPAEMKQGFFGRLRAQLPELLKRHHAALDAMSRVSQHGS